MQNTSTNVTAGNAASVKKQKHEDALPRFTAGGSHAFAAQEAHPGFFRRVFRFLAALFSRKPQKTEMLPAAATDMPSLIVVQSNVKEAPSAPAEMVPPVAVAITCAGTRFDAALRKIAEQQFAAMDVSKATMN